MEHVRRQGQARLDALGARQKSVGHCHRHALAQGRHHAPDQICHVVEGEAAAAAQCLQVRARHAGLSERAEGAVDEGRAVLEHPLECRVRGREQAEAIALGHHFRGEGRDRRAELNGLAIELDVVALSQPDEQLGHERAG
jgi:hypothetical protein